MQAELEALGIPAETRVLLERFAFNPAIFKTLRRDLAAGVFNKEANRTTKTVTAPEAGDITPWPEPGSSREKECIEAGLAAIRAGQVAVCILNGGMATRFGGVVKGVVEVVAGRSFLGLRIGSLAKLGGTVPVFLMNSFATNAKTEEHLREAQCFGLDPKQVNLLAQRISLRVDEKGELFLDDQGQPSPYAPGHGDVFEVLAGSDAFQRFVDGGGKVVTIGNVDNLGAELSPTVIGAHILEGRPLTVEVAQVTTGDKGGAPVRVGGRQEVLESYRYPEDFDMEALPVFNTNTLTLNAEAIKADYPLTWFRAEKKVAGRVAVQFERLMGEVTSFVEGMYLEVPRDGEQSRFLPVKTPDDLERLRPVARQRYGV